MINFTPAEWARLADYLAQELPASEHAAAEQWIAEAPDRQVFVTQLRLGRVENRVRSEITSNELATHVDRLVRTLTESIVPERKHIEGQLDERFTLPTHRFGRFSPVGIAALSLLLVLVGWVVGRTPSADSSGNSAIGSYVYITAPGEQATIVLPDGSTAQLNVASRLEVPTDYDRGNRTLRLTGEAFLSVSHNSGTPFTVIAGPSTSRVLGTRFVVRHYPSDSVATVAVHDGKIAVGSTILSAMQQVNVSETHITRVRTAHPGQFTFATGVLTLGTMSVLAAITELNRWYDADIRLGDPILGTQSVGGKFAAGSLSDLTELLEWTMNVKVVREGRVLTLYPR